ncbi:MAG: hypothetical protein Q7R60_01025 [bacterium]|nr:hypothetical protein [bacterium]
MNRFESATQRPVDTVAEKVQALRTSEQIVVAAQKTAETAWNTAQLAVSSLALVVENLRDELRLLEDRRVRIQTYEYTMVRNGSEPETTSVDRGSDDIPIIQGELRTVLSDSRLIPGGRLGAGDYRPVLRVTLELESKALNRTYEVPIDAIKSIEKYP